MDKYDLIDIVIAWLTKKDASYLSKEGQVVYYASVTGRKSDYRWYKLSLPETVRIISASELSADSTLPLKPEHVLTACQELERVYEMGINSRYPVDRTIFNYLERAGTDLPSMVMQGLARELFSQGYTAFKVPDLVDIFQRLNELLQLELTARAIADLYWCHFPEAGYEIRAKQFRVILGGKKHTVIMMPGLKPRHVVDIPDEAKSLMVRKLETMYHHQHQY